MIEEFNDKVGYYGELYYDSDFDEWVFKTLTGMRKYYKTRDDAMTAIKEAGLIKA